MPDAPANPPPPTDEEVAAILATAPFDYDAHQVIPADGDYPLVVSIARTWPQPDFLSWGLARGRWMARTMWIPVQCADPDYEPGAFTDLEGWSCPLADLVRGIPAEIRDAVGPLPSSFQWYAIKVLAVVPEFLDVVVEQPVLAALVASGLHPRGDGEGEALDRLRELLRGPRRRLLSLIDLPEEKWILGVLQKLDLRALCQPGAPIIYDLIRSGDKYVQKRLRHLPRLRGDVLQILNDRGSWPMTTFSLMADDTEDDFWSETSLHSLLVELHVARNDGRAPKKPARFKSRAEVLRAWEAIEPFDPVAEFTAAFETPTDRVGLRLWNEPAITLLPLRSASALLEHGKKQINCLTDDRAYYLEARTGQLALYSVEWRLPGDGEMQVATLSVRWCWDRLWQLEQLLGPDNEPVPTWVESRVTDWVGELNHLERDGLDAPHPGWLVERDAAQLALPFSLDRRQLLLLFMLPPPPCEARSWV